MHKRLVMILLVGVIGLSAGSASAASRCDTWHRRYPVGSNYVYTDHNTSDSADKSFSVPMSNEKVIVKPGTNDHNDPRYGVVVNNGNRNDAWVEALGGGGWGSKAYPYPDGFTGEGGVVQGDVQPSEVGLPADVNYSVWAFSLDDEGAFVWHRTIAGGCVSAGGTTASLGKAPSSSQPAQCSNGTATSTSCWQAPHGNCDATGVVCDEGIDVPTNILPHP